VVGVQPRSREGNTGTLLIIDETHTISAGPGGCTAAWGVRPDVVTIGKAIAGGIPIGAYGLSAELGARVDALDDADLIDVRGVGGTLAGNAPRRDDHPVSEHGASCRRRRRAPTSTATPRSSQRPSRRSCERRRVPMAACGCP
jgi:aminotransferase class III